MAQNFDLTQTGPELQARVDQVFPNRDAIEQETATREAQDESLETSLKAYTDTEQARAEAVEGALDTRVSANEVDIDLLKSQYEALTQSDIIVGPLPSTGQPNKIYRVPGSTYYTDYMWANGGWVKLAEYSTLDGYVYKGIATPSGTPVQSAEAVFYFAVQPGTYTNYGGLVVTDTIAILKYNGTAWTKDDVITIDDEPTAGSDNLVTSGAVAASVVYDISAANAVGGQLATYADLAAALDGGDNVPVDIRKGGMEIKFVQNSDNKYVQYRLMSDTFNTTVANWQGVDDVPTAGSDNLVKSGGAAGYVEDKENFYSNTVYDFATFPGIIASSGKWDGVSAPNSYSHILLRVKESDVVDITNDLSTAYYTAFLASIQNPINGESVDIAGSLTSIPASTTTRFVAPAGAVCFYLPIFYQGTKTQFSKVAINGYDLTNRLLDYINDIVLKANVTPEIPLVTKLTGQIAGIGNLWTGRGIITSSGNWEAKSSDLYKFSAIEVKEGDVITVKGETATTYCGFFATVEDCLLYKNRVGQLCYIPNSGTINWTVPAGAKCFEFSVLNNGTDVTPSVLNVNGIDVRTSICDKLTMESVRNNAANINSSFSTLTRLSGIILGSNVWGGVGTDIYSHIYIPVNAGDVVVVNRPNITTYGLFVKDVEIAKNNKTPNAAGSLVGVVENIKNSFTAPADSRYFVLTTKYNNTVLTFANISINGLSIYNSVKDDVRELKDRAGGDIINLTVDINGNGDFTSLRDCMVYIGNMLGRAASSRPSGQPEWVDGSAKTNINFNVNILPGTYDVRSYYTNEEWESQDTIGLIIPRGVNLIGKGKKKDDVIITCTSETNDDLKSTLNIQDDVRMENLTVVGIHTRYVVHDDYCNYPYSNIYGSYRDIKNVDFIGENLIYLFVYGSGTKGGANWNFENCRFINRNNESCWSTHDRNGTDQTKDEFFKFSSCDFIGSNGNNSIRFMPLTGACNEIVNFIGCNFKGINIVGEERTTTVYDIRGYGNTKNWSLNVNDNDVAKQSVPKFSDEVMFGFNIGNDTINYGDYVTMDSNKNFVKSVSQTDYKSIETIVSGSYGCVLILNS